MNSGYNIILEDLEQICTQNIDWLAFANKTILVTGANGFLPAYMVQALLYASDTANLNITVLALVRNEEKAKKRFVKQLSNPNLVLIVQDVCDPILYNHKIDFIVHAASQASPKYYSIDPVGTLNANILGTINLLNLARKNEVDSFLYFSSAEIYGVVKNDGKLVNENDYGYLDPLEVRSCYAESKRMGENLCISYAHQYGVKTRIVRPFHTFGPGMDLQDGRVFADFVANIINNSDIVMKSDGSSKRAYCYITDAVTAYFKVLLEGDIATSYNVGNPNNVYSVLELATMLVDSRKDKNLRVVKKITTGDSSYIASGVDSIAPDISRAKKLGWVPKVTAEEGFNRTILSYFN